MASECRKETLLLIWMSSLIGVIYIIMDQSINSLHTHQHQRYELNNTLHLPIQKLVSEPIPWNINNDMIFRVWDAGFEVEIHNSKKY
jgi:hypothetical protein